MVDMRVLLQKELNTEESLYDAELGMRPPLKIFVDEVCQFATRKRVASSVSPLHALKKSRAADPSVALSFADIPLVVPFGTIGAPIIILRALIIEVLDDRT
ncbi:hypothetical protein COCNU_06G004960 [Cocos nucifera]|uniref:Uncharacterized protein n=1 Tax=Cocos nucifera TaxID=13894 RepID=A0A8K0IBD6_COCNU|nr:hypothetical protein COCNU_06G004960 [Cocos nucifera]